MPKGGARNRSGPQPDPRSGRSERRGLRYDALPAGGYDGEVPAFPLPGAKDRELAIWNDAWTTPQACAWARESWRWQTVAEYARVKALCEVEPNAALIGQIHRYRDQLGLTPAGLRENGWAIAADEVAARADERVEDVVEEDAPRRLTAVPGA